MKEVKAIIQPFRLSEVLRGLSEIDDLPAADGFRRFKATASLHPEYEPRMKTKLEIMVPDEMVEASGQGDPEARSHRQSRRRPHFRDRHRGDGQDTHGRTRYGRLTGDKQTSRTFVK